VSRMRRPDRSRVRMAARWQAPSCSSYKCECVCVGGGGRGGVVQERNSRLHFRDGIHQQWQPQCNWPVLVLRAEDQWKSSVLDVMSLGWLSLGCVTNYSPGSSG
jgi:hypothetical protein